MLAFVFQDTVEITKQQFPDVHYEMSLSPLFFPSLLFTDSSLFWKALQVHCKCITSALKEHSKCVTNALQEHCKFIARALQVYCKCIPLHTSRENFLLRYSQHYNEKQLISPILKQIPSLNKSDLEICCYLCFVEGIKQHSENVRISFYTLSFGLISKFFLALWRELLP